MTQPRILVLDIETSPHVGYFWGLFKQNIGIDQIIEPSRMIAWAAKWRGEKGTVFGAEWQGDDRWVERLHELIEQADAIVHYNGTTFDWPIIKREFKELGLDPLPEPTHVDLLHTIKTFRLASNKLDWAALRLLNDRKKATGGFALWVGVLNGDTRSQTKMEKYNRYDVVLTDRVLTSVWPHVNALPNFLLFNNGSALDDIACPRCGSKHVQRRGYKRTKVSAFPRFQCQKCKGWFQRTTREFGVRVRAI